MKALMSKGSFKQHTIVENDAHKQKSCTCELGCVYTWFTLASLSPLQLRVAQSYLLILLVSTYKNTAAILRFYMPLA